MAGGSFSPIPLFFFLQQLKVSVGTRERVANISCLFCNETD